MADDVPERKVSFSFCMTNKTRDGTKKEKPKDDTKTKRPN